MKNVRIVVATTASEEEFYQNCWLGKSIRRLAFRDRIVESIHFNNRGEKALGLCSIYNQYLATAYEEELLLFVHDDVWIHDTFLWHRLSDALHVFDVIGVAGNKDPEDPAIAWAAKAAPPPQWYETYGPDRISGAVSHGSSPFDPAPELHQYGNVPEQCKLIDGMFIAVNVQQVLKTKARFDESFRFHFYDLDFSKTCCREGVRLGTWPIATTHRSTGAFGTPSWADSCVIYLEKWYGAEERKRFEQAYASFLRTKSAR